VSRGYLPKALPPEILDAAAGTLSGSLKEMKDLRHLFFQIFFVYFGEH
jgi:hypothetical protein